MTLSLHEKLNSLVRSFSGFYPETALVLLFILLIFSDLIFHKRTGKPTGWVALLGLGSVLFLSGDQYSPESAEKQLFFLGLLQTNNLIIFFKCLAGALTILTILFSWTEQKAYARSGEFYVILTALLLGLHLMLMSATLLMLYLAIELVSVASYILTSFSDSRKSAGGGLRYILFGAMSSGVMLYGMSWLYGLTGSLTFTEPAFWTTLAAQPALLANAALVLTSSGLLFKIAAVPFQVWAPDVYQAAPIAVVAFFSVAPKVIALVVLLTASQAGAAHWPGFGSFMATISLASITVGNFAALVQRNARRMLAYSSVAHTGFLLIGIVSNSLFALQSFVFYSVVYLFMNLAAFVLLHWLERSTGSEEMTDYQGLGLRRPWVGIALVIVMIALAGLPPTAGFTAKLLLFSALWETYQNTGDPLLLALFGGGLVTVAVSIFYYLRIPYFMFFRKSNQGENPAYPVRWAEALLLAGLLIPVLLLFFKSDLLTEFLGILLR